VVVSAQALDERRVVDDGVCASAAAVVDLDATATAIGATTTRVRAVNAAVQTVDRTAVVAVLSCWVARRASRRLQEHSGAQAGMTVGEILRLAGSALGALGGLLVFIEFFQTPNYVSYNREWDDYEIEMSPREVEQYTWIGRAGGLLVGVGFALLFVGTLVG
jgi:hypothetical protein